MSSSPKYADVKLVAARARQLAERLASRLAERKRRRQEQEAARAAAADRLAALLAEAEEAGAELPGAADAASVLQQLRAGGNAPAEETITRLDAEFETWLAEQNRTELIIEAMRAALPAAGLTVADGTFRQVGSGASFVAYDAAQRPIEIAVDHEGESSRLVYRTEGTDFRREETVAGEVTTCDDTEALLNLFHGALAGQDVEAGELDWAGRPHARPDRPEAVETPRSEAAGTE